MRAARLGQRAVEQIRELRAALDADPASAARRLLVAFDGGYTNQTVLKHLPHHTTAIGRLRQDAQLLFPPDPATRKARGRRLCYGPPAPTPEQVRTDDSPWQTFTFTHHGVTHQLRFKRRTGLMWRAAGAGQLLQLIVIAPLAYRLRKGSKLLYRQPAFLICTDPNLDPQLLIETYFHRWDIEVNFREEKTLLGVGQAQVRCPALGRIRPRLQRRRLRLAAPGHPARLRATRRPACCRAPSGVSLLPLPASPPSRPSTNCAPKSGAADSASIISPASRLTLPLPRSRRNAPSPSPPPSATPMPDTPKGQRPVPLPWGEGARHAGG